MTRFIRASMIDGANDCQLRASVHQWPDMFRARGYQPGHTLPTAGMAVGTAAHFTVAYMLGRKIETGTLGSLDEGVDRGKQKWKEEIAGGFQTDAITRTTGDATDQIARIGRTFSGLVGYRITPLVVEKSYVCTIKDDWALSGRVDYIPDTLDCLDLKTGRAKNRVYIGQIGSYSVNLRRNGMPPKRVGTLRIGRTGSNETPEAPDTTYYDREKAELYAKASIYRLIGSVETYEKTGKIESFTMNPSSWACSKKSCRAFEWCPAGQAKASHNKER